MGRWEALVKIVEAFVASGRPVWSACIARHDGC